MPVVAVIGAVAIAVMALLLLEGYQPLRRFFQVLFTSINLPGIRQLGNLLYGVFTFALDAIAALLHAAIAPLQPVIRLAWYVTWSTWDKLYTLAVAVVGLGVRLQSYTLTLYHKATYAIAHLELLARALIADAVRTVRSYALDLYHKATFAIAHLELLARALIADAVTTVEGYALELYHKATFAIAHLELALRAVIDETAGRLVRYTETLFARAIGAVADALAAAKAYALALYHAAVADAARYTDTAVAATGHILVTDIAVPVEQGILAIGDDVAALEGILATDLPDLGALIRDIPKDIPLELTAALGAVMSLARVNVRYLRECGVPNCKNLGGLGRELADLLSVASDAALLALIVEAIHDPDTLAREIVDVGGPIIDGVGRILRDAVGV